jgi:spermidine synthase
MRSRVLRVALFLFGSGFTALVYQIVWMRELRLVFGFSTAASAAVMAIFLGGIGLGSALLGRRANASDRPLLFYGRLELAIAAFAAATPALLWLARLIYTALGGSFRLGLPAGTLLRLTLSALVLSVPTVLMGGSLPAAARAAQSEEDRERRRVAFLYGSNTLGAVAGALVATFFLLETLGNRGTLWLACFGNALVALAAISVGRRLVVRDEMTSEGEAAPAAGPAGGQDAAPGPPRIVLAAAALVGFVFLLMELVWYRMLSPLLGGSTYTFGLILAVALLGIGIGAAAYARTAARPATLARLAATCGIEAACLAFPFALGDAVALFTILRRPIGAFGFLGQVAGWTEVTCLVVLPAAVVAGFQFPLLVALLGEGRPNVAKDIGLVYAWNTAGTILGSLAGGFGLLPLLTAPGAWRFSVALLAALGGLLAAASWLLEKPGWKLALPAGAVAASLWLVSAVGPTAAWRHSPIGAGRVEFENPTPNGLQSWLRNQRRTLRWEADGVESSVGLLAFDRGLAFAINGKIDGSSVGDAPTQVMGGLVGAILHPQPRSALVVGLGTGSTAGWLGHVASIGRVDVVELEPAVLEVARACAPVNRNVLANPRVRILTGDAREFMLTARDRYDLIFSEPSNPYRAGISSLFTREFYQAARGRLAAGGIFIQWLQAYEVDSQTVRTTYATLASVFPFVETWFTKKEDLLLVGTADAIRYPADALRARVREEPYRSALLSAWRVAELEGFLSHYVARDSLARVIALSEEGRINTDDLNRIEFGFARSVGQGALFESGELREAAHRRAEDRPAVDGKVDWEAVGRQKLSTLAAEGIEGGALHLSPEWERRSAVFSHFVAGRLGEVRSSWKAEPWEPEGPLELAMVGEALADGGDPAALAIAESLSRLQPAEANAIAARFLWTRSDWEGCFQATRAALELYRGDPWPLPSFMNRLLAIAVSLPSKDARLSVPIDDLLTPAFCVSLLDQERVFARIAVSQRLEPIRVVEALRPLEPHFPWSADLLELRARVYEETHQPSAAAARRELEKFRAREPVRFDRGLLVPPP